MAAKHVILEIRTSRDNEHTPETAVQLFATLPQLKNNWWFKLLKKSEQLSFEILSTNQTIYFYCYTPERLKDYLKTSISASYPEAIITELEEDPVAKILNLLKPIDANNQPNLTNPDHPPLTFKAGRLELANQQYFPLKNYRDFSNIDPLVTVLNTFSQTQPNDHVLVQYLLNPNSSYWQKLGLTPPELSPDQQITTTEQQNPQQLAAQKKTEQNLRLAIKILVLAETKPRANLLLETLATAYNSISKSDSNSLRLRKVYLFKNNFLASLLHRSFARNKKQFFTLEELATLYHLPNKQLSTVPNIAWGKKLLGDPPENLPIVTPGMSEENKKEINIFAQTTFKNQNVKYGLIRQDRRRHMYVIGKTGTGKSTMLANMAISDLKKNEGMCVIDPHGDLVETLLDFIPSHRVNDVVYFNPADQERTVQINLFEGKNVVHRELIASGIVSVFKKLYEYSWGPRLEYILRNALLTLLKTETAKLSDILNLLTDNNYRNRIVETLDDPILKDFWLNEFNRMPDRLKSESISPILNKVGQFTSSPLVRNVVNTNKSSFSIEETMDNGKILLANLSQGKLGEDNATLLGAMLITKIQLAAMGRVNIPETQRKDFYLYVDEFQNFATQSFIKILSEARKYRLNLILANQYIDQIPEEVRQAIFGNCGTIASFVMGASDAELFTKEYGNKYTSEDLVSLDRYQIINKIMVDNVMSAPFPAYTLPLYSSINQRREKVIRSSRERYAKKK